MTSKVLRRLLAVALLATVSSIAAAQQRPSSEEAQALLRARPDLVGQLRARIMGAGLTRDQVHARLKAEGYPEDLLDAYLTDGQPADSTAVPGDEIFEAARALGLPDSTAVDSLRMEARRRRARAARTDSAFMDTLRLATQDDTTREAIRRLLRNRHAQIFQEDSGYVPFGLSLFEGETSQFNANVSGPVDENYRLGPGDHLVLFLTGDVEAAYQLTVTREGFVVIPSIGQVSVANLTKAQLDDLLYARLKRAYSGLGRGPGATTRFSLNVSGVGTNQVFVTGDVKKPGAYRVSRAGTMLNAVYAAEGPSESGSMRAIQLRRGGQIVGTLDVYDYLTRGDASHDLHLESGDIVFVPPHGPRVRIAGGVVRPATYELKVGETLASLIDMAGGFTADADRRRVQIDRIIPPAERTSHGADHRLIEVASALLATGSGPAEPLAAGDVVRVFRLPEHLSGRVAVQGNVWSPGAIGFVPGMHLSEAVHRAGGLKPDSYLGEIQVSRTHADSTREMLRTAARDTSGTFVNDIVLQDGDEIRVFSITDFRPKRYVMINGAVRHPGRVPYHDGMTLRDLVLLAGGVKESALLTEAEIARMPENRAAGVTAVTTRVPLDSTYLFERAADGAYRGPPGVPAPSANAPEVELKPYDAVLIFQQPDWSLERSVAIEGEVRYPGRYTLTTRGERLDDLIKRAGGLTPHGYANGIVFVRKHNELGRIGIDLPAVLRNPNHVDNLTLLDGDSIFVPVYQAVVTVKGEVNSPVAVSYVPNADLDFYIRAAGGGTVKADVDRAYVMQPNGKVESRNRHMYLWKSTPHPRAGSTVFVPVKDTSHQTNWVGIATALTSILGSAVGLAAILKG